MKKTLLSVFALAATVALAAEDSYLYWMVDDDPGVTWTAAQIKSGDSYLTLYDADNEGGVSQMDKASAVAGFYSDVGSTYLLELLWGDTIVASKTLTAGSPILASELGMSMSNPTASSRAGDYTITGNVPEPTSGLLMLVGGALLALRRRRRA